MYEAKACCIDMYEAVHKCPSPRCSSVYRVLFFHDGIVKLAISSPKSKYRVIIEIRSRSYRVYISSLDIVFPGSTKINAQKSQSTVWQST
jgi:hypothetical protein